MRTFSIFLLLSPILFGSCFQDTQYPKEVSNLALENEYDLAKFNLSMLYLTCCDQEHEKQILSTELEFDTIYNIGESTFICFETEKFMDLVEAQLCDYYHSLGFDDNGNMFLGQDDLWVFDFEESMLNEKVIRKKLSRSKDFLTDFLRKEAIKRKLYVK